MHVAPVDLRAIRQDGLQIRFAILGSMAYVLGEIPETGSAGTSLEQPCAQAHWGMVIGGELTYVAARRRLSIPAGRVFHIPVGTDHHFEATGPVIVAGFQPIEDETAVTDEALRERGFQFLADARPTTIVPPVATRRVPVGQVRGESWRMPPFIMTRVRMGERSGYTAGWCDAPHWGLVTEGRLAIEWEDDVEILSKGDIFHCPAGPPGHRFEAADPATFVDLTPISALEGEARLADWRRAIAPEAGSRASGIAVAALG